MNAKLDELRRARANEFLNKWEKSSSQAIKWMETCESTMQFDIEEQHVLVDVRERLDDIDVSVLGFRSLRHFAVNLSGGQPQLYLCLSFIRVNILYKGHT